MDTIIILAIIMCIVAAVLFPGTPAPVRAFIFFVFAVTITISFVFYNPPIDSSTPVWVE